MGWEYLWILLAVSLALCAVGFYKYVYFLSIGYGLAVAGIGVALCVMSICGAFSAGIQSYIMFALFVVYGARLSGFLLARELKNAAYRKTLSEAAGDETKMPVFVKFAIWLCVGVLYVAQTSPVFFKLYNAQGNRSTVLGWAAIAVCAAALLLETAADRQKSEQKQQRPDMVATKGLYRIVRCPNYLGEILFWTGVFISALDVLTGVGQWLTAAIAYVCIVYVMFNGAQRLEKRQMKRYGDSEEYNTYADRTPIIIPLVPLYHLNKKEDKQV